jgi:tRNA threonylcarbamoyladenosine modification (KEOPS) complex Cgi121 subunit
MEIVLYSKGENYIVLIDEEDFHKVSKYSWNICHKSNTKYCQTNIYINGKITTLPLHRFLMNLEHGDKRIINHIDGNGLNNTKSNLEICDQIYNCQSINTKRNFGCITILKDGRKKKYRAEVIINKKKYQKYFYTYAEAEAYLDTLKELAIAETLPFNN